MAKKRRKPRSRPHPGPQGTQTADRPATGPKATKRPGVGAPGKTAAGDGRGPQRARSEKKDLARHQRELVRKQLARQRRTRQVVRLVAVAAVVGVGAFFFLRPDNDTRPEVLPGELATEAPWLANAAEADDRADLIDLPGHGPNLAMHEHVNVQVIVHGRPEAVPVNIGIDGSDIASIHTHSADGLVHVESSTVDTFTLGDFFDIWGVRLTPSCVGGYCNDDTNQIRIYVGGTLIDGNPREFVFRDQSVIVVTYGTEDELPDPIPSSFDFGSINP